VVELDVLDGLVVAHDEAHRSGAPALDDALGLAARLGLAVQIDVKVRGLEDGVVEALARHGLLERAFVSSFSHSILAAFARVRPDLARSLTYPEDRHGLSGRRGVAPLVRLGLAALRASLPYRLPRWLAAVDPKAVTLNWAVVTRTAVEVCHRRGVAVYVWTVNEPALARTLVESGIDGIITDDPRIIPSGTTSRS
jgi:glycerophosphoryl diester phosphodiesterase